MWYMVQWYTARGSRAILSLAEQKGGRGDTEDIEHSKCKHRNSCVYLSTLGGTLDYLTFCIKVDEIWQIGSK